MEFLILYFTCGACFGAGLALSFYFRLQQDVKFAYLFNDYLESLGLQIEEALLFWLLLTVMLVTIPCWPVICLFLI